MLGLAEIKSYVCDCISFSRLSLVTLLIAAGNHQQNPLHRENACRLRLQAQIPLRSASGSRHRSQNVRYSTDGIFRTARPTEGARARKDKRTTVIFLRVIAVVTQQLFVQTESSSSTSLILAAKSFTVNGFWMKCTPSSSTPWWAMTSAV